ncbi:3-hydroxyacyl-ACP dehydratase FabZ family protein [Sphaerimonospora mesophila]|uniref:3-hydroxyacyl-ACP dehydratase FabZ family protein n=1 Tax=Sphaerimonospora mesophila TaxID=37483 RepID=UPI0007C85B36
MAVDLSRRLDHAAIRDLLPHRHPMLLVDRVETFVPGESLVAVKAISACEPCYRSLPEDAGPAGHAYPASLLIESFGQAAALLWLLSVPRAEPAPPSVPMFAAARDCVIERPVHPGDVVRHLVRLEQVVDGAAFAGGESRVGSSRVASYASLMAVIRPTDVVLAAGAADGDNPHDRRSSR